MEAVRTLADFANEAIAQGIVKEPLVFLLSEAVQECLKYLDGDDYLSPEEIEQCKEDDERMAEEGDGCTLTHDHRANHYEKCTTA